MAKSTPKAIHAGQDLLTKRRQGEGGRALPEIPRPLEGRRPGDS